MDIFSQSIDITNTEDEVLNAIIIGQSCSGKSSSIGTLSGEKILYISAGSETHGVNNAIKHHKFLLAEGKVKESKFILVNLGVMQDLDIKTGLFDEGVIEVGGRLPDEAQEVKLSHYLNLGNKATTVVVDGLTAIYEVFVKSQKAQSQCVSKAGNWDMFAEYRVVGTMYNDLVEKLVSLNSLGVKTICTCLAKLDSFKEQDGIVIPTKFSPDLPSVNISKNILARFPTTVLCFRHPSILNNTPHFNFNIKGGRTTKVRNSDEIANSMNVDLRLQYLPFGKSLNKLPADWGNLKANVEKVLNKQEDVDNKKNNNPKK